MRKVSAILLLAILLFNWVGYRVFINFIEYTSDIRLEARLNTGDYELSRLIELKLPLSLPYQANWSEYERCDGEIEVNGIHYKFVKRKIYNDSLVLLCLPNEHKLKIELAKEKYYKLVNNLQTSTKTGTEQKNTTNVKNPVSDYLLLQYNWNISAPITKSGMYTLRHTPLFISYIKLVSEHPPETYSC